VEPAGVYLVSSISFSEPLPYAWFVIVRPSASERGLDVDAEIAKRKDDDDPSDSSKVDPEDAHG
jgi:hypothetical protein